MYRVPRLLLAASLLTAPAAPLLAQPALDPSGHWTGAIHVPAFNGAPSREVAIDIDLINNAGGVLGGTFSQPEQGVKGLPLSNVSRDGHTVPFDLKRIGDARIAAAPKSAPIGKELEGTWNGAIDVGGKQERLVLTMTNHADGTASGTIQDLDGSNVEIPIAITQKASDVTIDVTVVGASYTAALNANGELSGTWAQGPVSLPLTFKRVSK